MGTPPQNPWDQSGQPGGYGGEPGQYGQPGPYGRPGEYGQPGQPGQYGQYGQQSTGRYASWGKRFVALLLDSLLLFPVLFVGTFIAGAVSDPGGDLSGVGLLVFVVTIVGAWLVQFWNRCIRAGRTGQSVGRQVMEIWLLEEATGRPMGTARAFVRELAHFLDGLCYVGYIYAAFDAKTQTFADKIMKTVVVSR